VIAWRVEKKKWVTAARSGDGARSVGGRWNSPGLNLIYASEHLSLALLEILVHAPLASQRTVARARARIAIPDTDVEVVAPKSLPAEFGPETAYVATQAIGDRWIREQRSVALVVPSAIVPTEHNILLNPAHPAFPHCAWSRFEDIQLDPRLWVVP
jgi:RES domain-containing protein